ncbi:MAG: Sec-independent protein translocase protein TatB [Ilumatobacteraceae bacterium]
MFNLQGGELIIIALLALVVLGPEKLPEAARWVGRMYAQIRQLGDGFNREFQSAVKEPLNDLRDAVAEPVNDMKASMNEAIASSVPDDQSGIVSSTEQSQYPDDVEDTATSEDQADDEQGTAST